MRSLLFTAVATLTLAACAEVDRSSDDVPSPDELAGQSEVNRPQPATELDDQAGEGVGPAERGEVRDDGGLGSDRGELGGWTSKGMAGGPAALFGKPQTEARFSVRCDDSELVFTRSARLPAGPVEMTLLAGGVVKVIAAKSSPDPMPTISGRLPASDPFAKTLADAELPIAVRLNDQPSLRMPWATALQRVIMDCRTG